MYENFEMYFLSLEDLERQIEDKEFECPNCLFLLSQVKVNDYKDIASTYACDSCGTEVVGISEKYLGKTNTEELNMLGISYANWYLEY